MVPKLWLFYCCFGAILIKYSSKIQLKRNSPGCRLAGGSPRGAVQQWAAAESAVVGTSQVNVLILNITDNSQRKRLQGVNDAGCVMPNLLWYCFVCRPDRAHPVTALLCAVVGAKDLQGMQVFQSWIKRQSCIAFWLILMIHGFQIWVCKIKNEKHAVLFLALQK